MEKPTLQIAVPRLNSGEMTVSKSCSKDKDPNLAPSLTALLRWLAVSILASRPPGHLVRHFASAVRPESLRQRRINLSACTPGFRVSTLLNSSTLIPSLSGTRSSSPQTT